MDIEIAKNISKTLNDYIKFYSKFLAFEQEKLEAVEQNRLELLDGLVKQEEVFVLKSKGMELNRLKYQSDNGFANKTLREIIEVAPDEVKDELLKSFKELNGIIQEIQQTSEHCSIAIKARLQAIEHAMSEIKNEDNQKTYDDNANSQHTGRSFFSSKV